MEKTLDSLFGQESAPLEGPPPVDRYCAAASHDDAVALDSDTPGI